MLTDQQQIFDISKQFFPDGTIIDAINLVKRRLHVCREASDVLELTEALCHLQHLVAGEL